MKHVSLSVDYGGEGSYSGAADRILYLQRTGTSSTTTHSLLVGYPQMHDSWSTQSAAPHLYHSQAPSFYPPPHHMMMAAHPFSQGMHGMDPSQCMDLHG